MEIAIDNKILKFNYCEWGDSIKLIQYLVKILKNNVPALKDIMLNAEGINKAADTLKDKSLDDIIYLVMEALSNAEFYDLALKMATNCIYDNSVINENFFKVPDNRVLFFPLMFHIIKNNLVVFFSGLKNISLSSL